MVFVRFGGFGDDGEWRRLEGTNKSLMVGTGEWTNVMALLKFIKDDLHELVVVLDNCGQVGWGLSRQNGWELNIEAEPEAIWDMWVFQENADLGEEALPSVRL